MRTLIPCIIKTGATATMRNGLLFLAALLIAGLVAPGSAAAADVSFKGKTLQMVIASEAGGGTDLVARDLGAMLNRYLPGGPDVVYRNVGGGGGVKALNYFATSAKPDGIWLVASSLTSIEPHALRSSATKYDPRKFIMIGGIPQPGSALLVRKDAIGRLTDKSAEPVIMGDRSGLGGSGQMGVWGPEFLGWNMRWVVGYSGAGGMNLALMRGEIHALAIGTIRQLGPLLDSGDYVVPAQTGVLRNGKLHPHPAMPPAPIFADLMKPKLSGLALQSYEDWEAVSQIGKWYALPEGTPAEIVAAYRAAWDKAAADPDFDNGVKQKFSEVYSTMSGDEMAATVARIASTTDESLDYIKQLRIKVGIPVGDK
jgi:tripartite-type tricarboxylate transporter receptor subunit TctC